VVHERVKAEIMLGQSVMVLVVPLEMVAEIQKVVDEGLLVTVRIYYRPSSGEGNQVSRVFTAHQLPER
jgi:hypothetical protein